MNGGEIKAKTLYNNKKQQNISKHLNNRFYTILTAHSYNKCNSLKADLIM